MEIAATVVVYAGLLAAALGLLCLIRPIRFLKIASRKRGGAVLGAGALLFLAGANAPVTAHRAAAQGTRLDHWAPAWQFSEFHSIRVRATPEQAYRAIREVTADEILFFRTLTWIRNPRRFWREQPENILNPSQAPILEVATRGGFRLLAEDAPREIVLGTVVMWDGTSLAQDEASLCALIEKPGNAFATINFRTMDQGDGWCMVSTETRVHAPDAVSQRRFARYWRVIYPGSSLLRYTWLQAIARRVERDSRR